MKWLLCGRVEQDCTEVIILSQFRGVRFCLLKGRLCLHKVLKVVVRKRLQCDPEGGGSLSYPVKIEHEVSTLIIEGPNRYIYHYSHSHIKYIIAYEQKLKPLLYYIIILYYNIEYAPL